MAGKARIAGSVAAGFPLESSRLYEAIDALNARYGKGMLVSARQGLKTQAPAWKMKREHLSKRASTRWAELMTAR